MVLLVGGKTVGSQHGPALGSNSRVGTSFQVPPPWILQSHPLLFGCTRGPWQGLLGGGAPSWVFPATLCPGTSCPPPPVSPQQGQLGLETVGVMIHLELGKVPRVGAN